MARRNVRTRILRVKSRLQRGITVQSFTNALTSITRNPVAMLFAVGALLMYTTELSDSKTSIIAKIVSKYGSNATFGPAIKWVGDHRPQFIGYVGHLSAIFSAVPSASRLIFMGISAGICFALPSAGYSEYLLQTLFLFLFYKMRNPNARLIIILAAIAAYIGGYFLTHIK